MHRVVGQAPEPVAEAEQHEHEDRVGQAGEEREQPGHDAEKDGEARAAHAVAEIAERNGEAQHDRDVEDDDQPEALDGEAEGVSDVGSQRCERGGVELVEEEQQEEDGQREERLPTRDLGCPLPEPGDHARAPAPTKCSWASTSSTGTTS